jgi:hypothetical protein
MTAVVVASGRSVWADLRAIAQPNAPVFAVNEMIQFAPRLDYGVSHHKDKLPHWLRLRSIASKAVQLHSSAAGPGITRAWPELRSSGSSSLLAVRIALRLGHAPVWVAGVPLDAGGYVWDDPRPRDDTPVKDFSQYRTGWLEHRAELQGRVYSPSGFLRELLGCPVECAA